MESKRGLARPVWCGIGLVAAIALLLTVPPFNALLNYSILLHHLEQLGSWAVFLFVLAHIVAAVLSLPGTVLVVAGGAVFGLLWGTVWSVIGATLGAIASFLMARYLLRDWVMRRFQNYPMADWFQYLSDRQALSCVIAIRFTPISPFCIVNFLLGLTPLPLKPYALGTLVGIIPGTIAYTWLGVTGEIALQSGSIGPFMIALTVLALLALLPLFLKPRRP